jgi:uncharacterized membrane protein
MSASSLVTIVTVPFYGGLLCVAPAITRPTLQFGVRIPAGRAGAPVIRRERRAYFWRTAAIGVCCTVAAVLTHGYGSWWLGRIILLLELAADLGCFQIARKNIAAAKNAEGWFAGLRQTVTTDTSWRTDPPRFPVRWLLPALMAIAATIIVGAVRYPGLPARLPAGWGGGHHAPKSIVTAFALVVGQLYVTALWTGLMLIVYRSRPDIESADAAESTRRYRKYLAAITKAVLTLLALVNVTLLLATLPRWQVYRLSGIAFALPLLPLVAGLLILAVVAVRVGQGGSSLPRVSPAQIGGARLSLVSPGHVRDARPSRLTPVPTREARLSRVSAGPDAGPGRGSPARTDRDDDRFWKAGLFYVNRDDPAVMVGNRFGVGWTFNFGNRIAWLILAGMIAAPAGLAAILAAVGV